MADIFHIGLNTEAQRAQRDSRVILVALLLLIATVTGQAVEAVHLTIRCEGRESMVVVPVDSAQAAISQALRELASNGYPLAEIVSVEEDFTSPASVTVTVKPGLPLEGVIDQSAPVMPLSATALVTAAQVSLDSLTEEGFPLAEVEIKPRVVVLSDRLTAEVVLTAQPGQFLRLNALHFPGVVSTRQETLAKISRLHRGDVFSRRAMIRAEESLGRESYLAEAGPASLTVVGAGLVDVSIPIRERRANSVAAMAAYDPVADRPVGQVDLVFGNLMGTGRSLRVNWESLNPQRRRTGISYREPWLFGRPVSAATGFSQSSDDSTGATTAFQLSADWTPRLGLTLKGETGWETFAATNPDGNRSTATLEGELIWERQDHDWNPRRGWHAETSRRWGFRSDHLGGRTDLTRDRASLFTARPVAEEIIFCVRGALDDARGEDLLVTDVIRLGGAGTVRGYSEENFPTAGAVWGGLEGRWRPDEGGYAGLFVDQGWRYRQFQDEGGRKWLASYGLTGRIDTKAGLIGLDVGWAVGEPFQRGRLHVRFENRF